MAIGGNTPQISHNQFTSNLQQVGVGNAVNLKSLAKNQLAKEEETQDTHGESAQLSAAAQKQLQPTAEQSMQNARQSGAMADTEDSQIEDGTERNAHTEEARQRELGKEKDVRGQEAGVEAQFRNPTDGRPMDREEVSLEVGRLEGRDPEQILEGVPEHAKLAAGRMVESQPVGKLTELKQPDPAVANELTSAELQRVASLPVEVDEPHAELKEGPTLHMETPPDVQAHMEQTVAENALKEQNGGGQEAFIAGWSPEPQAAAPTNGAAAASTPKDPAEVTRGDFVTARQSLMQADGNTATLLQMGGGWGGEKSGTQYTRDVITQMATMGEPGASLFQQCQADAQRNGGNAHLMFCERGRETLKQYGDTPDVQFGYKMLDGIEASERHLLALNGTPPPGGSMAERQIASRMNGALERQGMTPIDKGDSKTTGAVAVAAGATALSTVHWDDIQNNRPAALQTPEENQYLGLATQARMRAWENSGVEGDASDAYLTVARERADKKLAEAEEEGAPTDAELQGFRDYLDYVMDMRTVETAGQALQQGDPTIYQKSPWAERDQWRDNKAKMQE